MSIMFISALVVSGIFGGALLASMYEIKHLRRNGATLRNEVFDLKEEMASRADTRLSVILTLAERQIVLGALKTPQYKEWVTAPATKHIIRAIYHALVKKIKRGIRDQNSLTEGR